MTHFPLHDYFVSCAHGLEALLADELRTLRCRSVRPQRGGVLFKGTIKDGYRVCLWSRFGSRVLLTLGEVDARTADTLYQGASRIAWEEHVHPNGTIAVDSVGGNDALRNTQFINVRIKDAIVDRMRQVVKMRPNVDTENPDLRINVAVRQNKASIALDLAGEPLHRRRYRIDGVQVTAPMKETLAAALLTWAGWPRIAREGGPFVDFMCGSGTLPIEAAMMAGDVAPGLLRRKWGFARWLQHDEQAWDVLMDEAQKRQIKGLESLPPILASDKDAKSIEIARRSLRRAELEKHITLRSADLAKITRPDVPTPGLIALNPPYGKRMMETGQLPELYAYLKDALHAQWEGYRLALISSDTDISRQLGLKPQHAHKVRNGPIEAEILTYFIGKTPSL